jgi:hypothetical protein
VVLVKKGGKDLRLEPSEVLGPAEAYVCTH